MILARAAKGYANSTFGKPGTYVDDEGRERHVSNRQLVRTPNLKERQVVNWNNNHQLMLWMDVAGSSTADIAEQLGYTPQTVRAVKTSPVYHVQKSQLLETLQTSSLQGVLEKLRLDAPRNVDFLIRLRDGLMNENKDRLGAARQLSKEVDRVYPRVTSHKEERIVRIIIDAPKLARLTSALREMGAPIDAQFVEEMDPINGHVPGTKNALEGRSVQELVDLYRKQDADREAAAERT